MFVDTIREEKINCREILRLMFIFILKIYKKCKGIYYGILHWKISVQLYNDRSCCKSRWLVSICVCSVSLMITIVVARKVFGNYLFCLDCDTNNTVFSSIRPNF